MNFKELYEKWNSINIVIRIVAGLLIGLVLALVIPNVRYISLLGDLFIGGLKAIAPFLVFFLVLTSLAKSSTKHGKQFRLIIAIYILTTIFAAVLSTVVCFCYPVTVTLDIGAASGDPTTDISVLISTLVLRMVENPISALMGGNYIGVLFWAILGGLVMRSLCSQHIKDVAEDIAGITTSIIKIIISFAPFGILGIIYSVISENGTSVFSEYGQLLIILVGCMLVIMLIANPLIVAILTRRNPYPLLLKCLRDSAVTAFFMRSSAANIPMNLALCEKEGVDKEFYSVSIPLGATINMNGAAITITVMTLAAVFTLGLDVPFGLAALLCVVATVAACGASGVAGGSLLLIPMACSFFGIADDIAMQMVAIGFIIGVIQDSFETALNSSSDALFTIATDQRVKAKKAKAESDAEASE